MRRVVMLDTSEVGAAAMEREGAKPDNEYERTVVARVLRGLLALGAAPTDIAVLSPYNVQVDAMARDLASSDDLKEVEALTIDGAQGRDVEWWVIPARQSQPTARDGRIALKPPTIECGAHQGSVEARHRG